MSSDLDPDRELPAPDSDELRLLFPNRETREAYRFLYERRAEPPTMHEWTERAAAVLGRANVHTQRRLRDVRDHFVVRARKVGREWVYELAGWKTRPAVGSTRIPAALEAEVYDRKGRFCAMCGYRPADGAELQLDHILPRSWGGGTTFDNLEPLCRRHNQGKKAFFVSLSKHSDEIKASIHRPDPWERIGELMKAFAAKGEWTPAELIQVVARDTHRGDPKKRLRELRYILGWDIAPHRSRNEGVTTVHYELRAWKPWPPEGAPAVVAEYERRRKSHKRKLEKEGGDSVDGDGWDVA